MPSKKALKATEEIIDNLDQRRGFDFGGIDDDIFAEITDSIAAIIDKHMCSAGDAALLAEAANMLEQVIEAAEIAMKDVNAESSSDVWDVNHLLGPARGVLARCRAAHAAEKQGDQQ